MPREYGRNRRVADQIQRELAMYIQREMSDSHLKFVTISTVDVSPDLANAKVYVTNLLDDVNQEQVVSELNEQAGHFRHLLSQKLTLRSVPKLNFVFDNSVKRGNHLVALIDSLNKTKDK